MSNYSKLWIIPNEEQISDHLFYREIKEGNTHTKELLNFVKEYNVPVDFSEDDHHEAPCMVAEVGHLVIETIEEDSKVRFFLPEKLTANQLNFFSQVCLTFSNYEKVRCYSLKVLGEDGVMWKNIRDMQQVVGEVNSKNRVIISENRGKTR